jgi:hypothetical protein
MENANEAIYIGIYTLIFVIALSLTIFLFSSLMNYTDEAYDYIHQQSNDAVTVTGEVNRHLILNGQEVISYYYNYIKKDRYTDETVNSDIVVSINLNTKDESPLMLEKSNLTYKEIVNKIGVNNKYILTVDSRTNDDITYINIIKATDEELQEEW